MKKQLAPGLRGAVTRPMATMPKMTASSARPVQPEATEVEDEEQRQRRAVDQPVARRVGPDGIDEEERQVDEPGKRRPAERRRFGQQPDAHAAVSSVL